MSPKLHIDLVDETITDAGDREKTWFDFNLGPNKDGFRYTTEAQPVYPAQISRAEPSVHRRRCPLRYGSVRSGSLHAGQRGTFAF
jgi:hypothetical protein